MRKLLTLAIFLLALGAGSIAECVAQPEIIGYYKWSIPEPHIVIADAQRASIQQQESRAVAPSADMEEIPVLQFDEQMFGWKNTARYNFWQQPYSQSCYINRTTGEDLIYSAYIDKYMPLSVGWERGEITRKEQQRLIFAQMPTDSVFVINSLPRMVGEVWGCVDDGALQLYYKDSICNTFRECAETIYGSVEEFLSALQQRRQAELTEDINNSCLLNRFASVAEAESFLRNDYSIFATAFPNKKSETLQRFIEILARHTTISDIERKQLTHNKEQIATTAAIYEHPLRRAEFKRIFSTIFDKERGEQLLDIIAQNDAFIEDAEARIIYDRYAGTLHPSLRSGKAICIYLIHGVKIQIPRYEKTLG